METKPTKNNEPKAEALPDLPLPPDQAGDVKGGTCAKGQHIPMVKIIC